MNKEFNDYTVFTARILLGLIFTGAAFTKILDTASFAEIIKNNYKTEINISTLGPSFCNNYEIVPKQNSILSYNNSCISVITQ